MVTTNQNTKYLGVPLPAGCKIRITAAHVAYAKTLATQGTMVYRAILLMVAAPNGVSQGGIAGLCNGKQANKITGLAAAGKCKLVKQAGVCPITGRHALKMYNVLMPKPKAKVQRKARVVRKPAAKPTANALPQAASNVTGA